MTRKGALTRPWGAATRYVIAAGVAKLVDARDLKSLDGNVVWVRVHRPHQFPPWLIRISTRKST